MMHAKAPMASAPEADSAEDFIRSLPRGSAKKRAVTSATPPKSIDNATVAIVDSNAQNAKS